MFFLPLPLGKTLQSIEEVKGSSLPHPELYIMVNGKPAKGKVMWRTIVDVKKIKAAIHKLRQINWLYKNVDLSSIDEATKKVIETVTDTTSIMLAKASPADIEQFQCYTIRYLNQQCLTMTDLEQYKLMNIKEAPLDNRTKYFECSVF